MYIYVCVYTHTLYVCVCDLCVCVRICALGRVSCSIHIFVLSLTKESGIYQRVASNAPWVSSGLVTTSCWLYPNHCQPSNIVLLVEFMLVLSTLLIIMIGKAKHIHMQCFPFHIFHVLMAVCPSWLAINPGILLDRYDSIVCENYRTGMKKEHSQRSRDIDHHLWHDVTKMCIHILYIYIHILYIYIHILYIYIHILYIYIHITSCKIIYT